MSTTYDDFQVKGFTPPDYTYPAQWNIAFLTGGVIRRIIGPFRTEAQAWKWLEA